MAHFRFLHLSDFHFGAVTDNENVARRLADSFRDRDDQYVADADVMRSREPGYAYNRSIFNLDTHSENASLALSQFVFDHQDDFDIAVITGDLAATGRVSDLEVAADYFLSPYKRTFRSFPKHLNTDRTKLFVAGNHDRYHNIWAKPGCTNIDSLFPTAGATGSVYSSLVSKDNESVAFVFGDFCLKSFEEGKMTRAELFGFGKAYDDVIGEMQSETQRRRSETSGVLPIWCVHFAPFQCDPDLSFLDYNKLMRAASASRVPLMLCGHTHESRVLTGSPTVCVAGSATCCTDSRNDIHIIDLVLNRGKLTVTRENYRLDRRDVCFIPDPIAGEDQIFQEFPV